MASIMLAGALFFSFITLGSLLLLFARPLAKFQETVGLPMYLDSRPKVVCAIHV